MSKAKTFIVFLRGVTPTGKNKVPMAQLREELSEVGFKEVKTWIQSGNAIVKTELSREQTCKLVHDTILNKIGADLAIIVKTAEELQAVLDENPFSDLPQERMFYGLTHGEYNEDGVDFLLAKDHGDDKIAFTEKAIYVFIPGNAGQSKLTNSNLERKLKIRLTFRNRNTIAKVIELAQGKK